MPDMWYGSRPMSTTRRLNAFSLTTLVSNCILALATFLFEPTAVFYYLCVTINLVCLVVWLLRGERVEDFIALSNLFITIYILLPAPPNAATHYVFWGAPEIYSRLPQTFRICARSFCRQRPFLPCSACLRRGQCLL
jgi:hypothetical protein